MKQIYMPESLYPQVCEDPALFAGTSQIFTGAVESWNGIERALFVKISEDKDISGIMPLEEIADEEPKFLRQDIPAQARAILHKKICFYIDGIDPYGRILLSRRKLQVACKESLVEGEIRLAQVMTFHKAGIFVDFGCGTAGYIHFSELSISKFLDCAYAGIAIGSLIPIKVVAITPQIKLSYRQTFICRPKEWGEVVVATVLAKVPMGDGNYVYISPNEAGIVDVPKGCHLYCGQQIQARVKKAVVLPDTDGCTKVHYKLMLI